MISINSSWNICNFRRGIVHAFQREGFSIIALAPPDAWSIRLAELGVECVPVPIDSAGMSPMADLKLLAHYRRALKRIRPAAFLGYTVKPNIWGSLAARSLGIPVINNVSGLGTAFMKRGMLNAVVRTLYSLALRSSRTVFFQNRDDLEQFVGAGTVDRDQTRLLPGSGIDLDRFAPDPVFRGGGPGIKFLMVARLLWDKGVGEYVAAARIVREQVPDVRFQLLGFLDVPNRTAVPRENVEKWVEDGDIDYLGEADDVRPFIAAADCIVLPSYREGLPRSLLEGAAMGKPLIATDVPGCREVVEDGRNGYLCAARDPSALAAAMMRMVALDADERAALGAAARAKAEAEFDERIVVDEYLSAVRNAIGP